MTMRSNPLGPSHSTDIKPIHQIPNRTRDEEDCTKLPTPLELEVWKIGTCEPSMNKKWSSIMNNKYNKWSSIEIRWDSKRFACFEPSGSAKERRRRPGHQGRCRICFPKSLSKSARMKNKNTHADYRGIANSFTRSIKAYCHPSIFTSLSTLICIDCSPCLTPRKPSKAGSIHCRCRVSHCCLHLRHPIPHGRAFIQVEPPLQPVSHAIVEFEVNEDAFNLLAIKLELHPLHGEIW